MAVKFLLDLLTGSLALVNIPTAGPPPASGTALYADSTGISFIDGTDMDWIT